MGSLLSGYLWIFNWQAFNYAKWNNNKMEGKEILKKTYFTGFFFGMVIGMDLEAFFGIITKSLKK